MNIQFKECDIVANVIIITYINIFYRVKRVEKGTIGAHMITKFVFSFVLFSLALFFHKVISTIISSSNELLSSLILFLISILIFVTHLLSICIFQLLW